MPRGSGASLVGCFVGRWLARTGPFVDPSGDSPNGITRGRPLYNGRMARGWESKSVEAQQAEATEKPNQSQPRMSAEEAVRWREKEGLRLARMRVLQQLESSQNSRHRKLLQETLKDWDTKLSGMQ